MNRLGCAQRTLVSTFRVFTACVFLSCALRYGAQLAPGFYTDDNHPAGAPYPQKLDDVWKIDPTSGPFSIKIPFLTTPRGGCGPKIPFSLMYNSASSAVRPLFVPDVIQFGLLHNYDAIALHGAEFNKVFHS